MQALKKATKRAHSMYRIKCAQTVGFKQIYSLFLCGAPLKSVSCKEFFLRYYYMIKPC